MTAMIPNLTSIIHNTDSYKASHFLQYPPKTEVVNSYIEARGLSPKMQYQGDGKIVHFGLQMFLKDYMAKSNRVTSADIDYAEALYKAHGEPFNREGWEIIHKEHNGLLPVIIESQPEGLPLAPLTPLVQVRNTDERLPWVTSYLETALLRAIWYPSTVATVSRNIKLLIAKYMKANCDTMDGLPFKLHDFGCRGVSSYESAAIGGLAHLVNFMGTDTVPALLYARTFYDCDIAGFSIPAAEHSTITSWGRDGELDAYRNMLQKFARPGSLVAVVSDSYDIYHAAGQIWGTDLKDEVIASGATVVIRPDSGNPRNVVLRVLDILGERFGYVTNSKGFKVLPPCVRIIQGDGIDYTSIEEILDWMHTKGWAVDNIAFGMGGALLQHCNRDTFKYAMKASAAKVDGVWRDVFKDPVTDNGKRSKRGILSSGMETIWADGELKKQYTFDEVRANSLK
jgi:nicotinamide phosphoribosyltransferase